MMRGAQGSIVNLASVNQIVANPNLAAYTAAKGGIHALTKQLAVEYGPRGIRCNAISPALIATAADAAGRRSRRHRLDAEAYPIGRVGAPAEIVANAVVFLASDERASSPASTCPSTAVSPRWRRRHWCPRRSAAGGAANRLRWPIESATP